jgi:hypothetical protein
MSQLVILCELLVFLFPQQPWEIAFLVMIMLHSSILMSMRRQKKS